MHSQYRQFHSNTYKYKQMLCTAELQIVVLKWAFYFLLYLPLITRINIPHTRVVTVFYVFILIYMRYLIIGDTTNFHLCALIKNPAFANTVLTSRCGSILWDCINKAFQILCWNYSGTKWKVYSVSDRHLLMNNYPVHWIYFLLNQNSDKRYAADLIFKIHFALWSSGENKSHGVPAFYAHYFSRYISSGFYNLIKDVPSSEALNTTSA
jgi:hypothetical protein